MAIEGRLGSGAAAGSVDEGAPTGTVTFLFTDIEGSTRLLEQLRGRYAEVLADQRRILRDAFAQWHGHEIDTQGDSFFVAFPRASDALRCAIDAQRALAAWRWPAEAEVRVRMGIHTGEPLVATSGYVGMDVHRAARIAGAGHGGQILLSGTAHDLVNDDLPAGIDLLDLGSHRLKDLRAETRLYQVAGDGLRTDFAPLTTKASDEPAPTPGEPPYRGLQAFEERDAGLFYGRTEIVAEVVDQLRGARFLAVIGASGSGKSSILRAGVIPALREDQPSWRIHLLTPTAHPLEALADAIAPDASPAQVASLVDDLRTDPRSLRVALRPRSGGARQATGGTLLAVDQLEEVFTLCRDEAERKAFLAGLVHASGLDDGPADTAPDADRATVLITLRADFYAFLAPYPPLRDAAAASQRYVGAMSADELRRAIEEPARKGGWDFTPGLVDVLLSDVGDEPGALPLLSHALLETWRRRRGTTMTLRSYAESGGVKGAIARTADRVYQTELSSPQQRIARNIFVRLTELGEGTQDTRRRARLSELIPTDEREAAGVRAVIGALADARLVTVGEDTVEVAHEALIREWPTLREWLRSDRDALRQHRRLSDAARDWEASAFDDGLLYRGARLAQARESTAYTGLLNELERGFLEASIALEEREQAEHEAARQREVEAAQALAAAESMRAREAARSASSLRLRALLLGFALVVAGVLAAVAFVLARQSDANAGLAGESAQQARDNAALAEQRAAEASDNAALAQQRAQEARDSEALAQERAKQAIAQRLAADATQVVLTGRDPELAALLALNGLTAGYTPQADAALQRAGRAELGDVYRHDAPVDSLVVTPDGETMITLSGNQILVWDVAAATVTATLPSPGQNTYLELSNDGTVLLASQYGGRGALYAVRPGQPTSVEPIAAGCAPLERGDGIRTISGDGTLLATYQQGLQANVGFVFVTIPDCIAAGPPIEEREGINDPALSDDGTLLAANMGDNGFMRVWNTTTGREQATFGLDVGSFWHSTFSADGTKIVTANFDGTAHVFDSLSGELRQTYRGHGDAVIWASLSADGSRLVTSSFDSTARLWDTTTRAELRSYVHGDAVTQALLSADGKHVFSSSMDGTARRWSAGTSGEDFTFGVSEAEVGGLAFSPDGLRLAAVGGDSLKVFDVAKQAIVREAARPQARLVAFSPDGDSLLVTSSFGSSLVDPETGDNILTLSEADSAGGNFAASFAADGELALGSTPDAFGELAAYDTASGGQRAFFQIQTGVLSADGSKVAGWAPGRFSIYDVRTGDSLQTIAVGDLDGRPIDIAFTPDASRIVTGDHDNVVRVRDAVNREVLLEMPGHASPIRQVRVSADGAYVLSASDDGSARLWDLESGDLVRFFPGHDGRAITSIAISPDSSLVALGSSDGTVIVTPLSGAAQQASVCGRLSRDLSDVERAAYGIEGTSPTCP